MHIDLQGGAIKGTTIKLYVSGSELFSTSHCWISDCLDNFSLSLSQSISRISGAEISDIRLYFEVHARGGRGNFILAGSSLTSVVGSIAALAPAVVLCKIVSLLVGEMVLVCTYMCANCIRVYCLAKVMIT